MSDLELISTDDLIEELQSRHDEIIIIRGTLMDPDLDLTFAKTKFGELGDVELGYDLVQVTLMLNNAHFSLVQAALEHMRS